MAAQLINQTHCNIIDSHKGGIDQQPPQILVSHAATKMSTQQQEGNASLASTQPQKNTQLMDNRDTASPPMNMRQQRKMTSSLLDLHLRSQ